MITIKYKYAGRDVILAFDDDEGDDVQRSFDALQKAGIHFVLEVQACGI